MTRSVQFLRKLHKRLTIGIPFLAANEADGAIRGPAGGNAEEGRATKFELVSGVSDPQLPEGGTRKQQLDWFETGFFCLAHPNKTHKNPDPRNELMAFGAGEDSGFMIDPSELADPSYSSFFVGICDGVGGWAREPRAKPELYSRLICHFSKEYITSAEDPGQLELREIMNQAHKRIPEDLLGSTTALFVQIKSTGKLTSANLGDCSYIVLRDQVPLGHASVTTKSFNFPFQLGPSYAGVKTDTAFDAVEESIQLLEGDIVIAGSDGVWDNIFDDEIAEIFVEMDGAPLGEIARRIASRSRELGNRADSPFALRARQNGSWYSGGKTDDTTVVCIRYKGTRSQPYSKL